MPSSLPEGAVVRAAERSVLSNAVAALAAGRGGSAWITGEPGIGKTFLLEAAVAEATALGCTVLRGVGDELMIEFPLRLLADALGEAGRSRVSVHAELTAALREGTAAAELRRLVRRACAGGPVLLAADDLHWADEASLALWPRLVGLSSEYPLLVAGAARLVPPRAVVALPLAVVRGYGGHVITIRPLDADAAAALAGHFLGAVPGPALREELRRAGGNPAYLRELLTALDRAGLIKTAGGTAEFHGAAGVTPPQLALSVGRRLRFLGEQTRAVIRMAAVISGGGVTPADLGAVTGQTDTVIAATVAEASAAGLLDVSLAAEGGDQLTFRHELVRQALASEVPDAVSPVLHRHAARALANAGRRLEAVAKHMLDGPPVMEDWALGWLSNRSEASLYEVPRPAIELLENAIQALDDNDPRWEAFASRLAQARFWLGEDDDAFRMALEVARRSDDFQLACRMRIFAMRSAIRAGRYADGIAAGEAALAATDLPDTWRARLGSWLAVLLLLSGQPRQGDKLAFEALRLAAASQNPLTTATAHHAAAYGTGTTAAIAHAEKALAALGADAGPADLRLTLARNRLIGLARLGDDDELDTALAAALREADRVSVFDSVGILGIAAQARYRQGRWDEALEYLGRIDPAFHGHPDVTRLRGVEALVALHRGQRSAAAAAVAAVSAAAGAADDPFCMTASALAAEAQGDPRLAVRAAASWLDMLAAPHSSTVFDDGPDLVRLALIAGEPGIAGELAAVLEAAAANDPVPGRVLAARCARAQVTDDVDGLLAVAAEYGDRGWPLRQGMAHEEAAVCLARAGQPDLAGQALTEAADRYRAVGADWDTRRADARLREHSVRRGQRVAHRTASTGWEALTPAEQQVAELVADGLANAEIAAALMISQRTVRAHLSSVLAKLQLVSRAQLAAAMAAAKPKA